MCEIHPTGLCHGLMLPCAAPCLWPAGHRPRHGPLRRLPRKSHSTTPLPADAVQRSLIERKQTPATHRQIPLALCRVLEPAGLGPKADAAVGAGGDLRPEQLRGQPRDVPASPREHQVLTWPSIQAIHPYPMSSRCTVLGVHSCPWPGSWLAVAYWHACGTVSVLLPGSYDVPLPSAAARGSS